MSRISASFATVVFIPSYEIVNFGMYAGLGTKAVMDLSENYIHEGDIVILSPEQSEQTFSDYFNGEYMWQAADGAFGMLRDLKSENFEAMLGNFPRFARRETSVRGWKQAHRGS